MVNKYLGYVLRRIKGKPVIVFKFSKKNFVADSIKNLLKI